MSIRIIPIAAAGEAQLAPDTVWDGRVGDFAIAGADEGENQGGLRARQQLATAVLMCLMTDCAADPSELRAGEDNRGWPGDAISLVEGEPARPLGSKLWLLRRRAIDDADTPILAESFARAALETLVEQGACASVTVTAAADAAKGRLDLDVALKDRDGAVLLGSKFAILWEAVRAVQYPLAD
jgi:phage gp46-like protein